MSSFEQIAHTHAERNRCIQDIYEEELRDLIEDRLTLTTLDDAFMDIVRRMAQDLQVPVSRAIELLRRVREEF